jgi:hypothetical protein
MSRPWLLWTESKLCQLKIIDGLGDSGKHFPIFDTPLYFDKIQVGKKS